MRKTIKLFSIFCVLLCLTITVEAHSGKTDDSGGHYDNSAGEYHYHHGYPEHRHDDGVCPYGYENKESTNTAEDDDSNMTISAITIIVILAATIVIMSLVIRSKNKEIINSKHELFDLRHELQDLQSEINTRELECATPYIKEIEEYQSQISSLKRELEKNKSELEKEKSKIHNMSQAPNGITFAEDGMPIFWKKSDDKPYGDYTVFYSSKSKIYHVDRFCASYSAKKTHIFNVIETGTPCQKCSKGFFDFTEVPEWFTKDKNKRKEE